MISIDEDILVKATKRYSILFGGALAIALGGSSVISHFNTAVSHNSAAIAIPAASIIKDSKTGRCFSYSGDTGISAVLVPASCNSTAVTLVSPSAP